MGVINGGPIITTGLLSLKCGNAHLLKVAHQPGHLRLLLLLTCCCTSRLTPSGLMIGLSGSLYLWSPLLQLGVPPAEPTLSCRPLRELSPPCSYLCLIATAGPQSCLSLVPSSDVRVLGVGGTNNVVTQLPARVGAGLLPKWGTYLGPPCTWLGLGVGLLPIS